MNKLKYLIIAATVFAFSCSKDNADPKTLTGRWKYYGSSISAGGPQQFHRAAEDDKNFILFENNSKLTSTVFPQYVKYAIKDSVTVTFTKANNEIQNFAFVIKDNLLHLSPIGPGPVCIEGCSTSFIKEKD
jgi:hypothetical protein